jgi:hypothetical protein
VWGGKGGGGGGGEGTPHPPPPLPPPPPPPPLRPRECTDPDVDVGVDAHDLDVLAELGRRAMPTPQVVGAPDAGHRRTNEYVKLEWSTEAQHPLWRVVLQLHFVLPDGAAALDAFHRRVLAAPRPKNAGDVARWLAAVGCRETAEWRLEVEMRPPFDHRSVTQGLFLHRPRLVSGRRSQSFAVRAPWR